VLDGQPVSDESPPFSRETGILVSLGDDGEELRAHRREGGLWFFHRWRLRPDFYTDEPRWIGPQEFGMSATEIYDAAEALRRAADAKKMPTKGVKRG
jgi:hypothetical protein